MRYLDNFFHYIIESVDTGDFSEDYIDELLIPMNDLGIEYKVMKEDGSIFKTVTSGEFSGRGMVRVSFSLFDLKRDGDSICDDRFWTFLDEFISFKNRLESDKVSVYFNTRSDHYHPFFRIDFLVPGDFKSEIFELEEAYNVIKSRLYSGTTDFYYSTTAKIDKENKVIEISSDKYEYTDRKFNNLIRGIDIGKFNIEKTDGVDRILPYYHIKIKLK